MASKKEILNKLRILITQNFDNIEDAFHFFDKNGDGQLEKNELKNLIRQAEVNRIFSGIVASKMLNELDNNDDDRFNWKEFKKAVNTLLNEV
ncbi:MAG: EF-hand domain-containing protein [Bacteroidia bacterium]|nr:EF-hand domain-containing protein [Bacteroidia bacterium]